MAYEEEERQEGSIWQWVPACCGGRKAAEAWRSPFQDLQDEESAYTASELSELQDELPQEEESGPFWSQWFAKEESRPIRYSQALSDSASESSQSRVYARNTTPEVTRPREAQGFARNERIRVTAPQSTLSGQWSSGSSESVKRNPRERREAVSQERRSSARAERTEAKAQKELAVKKSETGGSHRGSSSQALSDYSDARKRSSKPQQKDSSRMKDDSHASSPGETRKPSTNPQKKDSRVKMDDSHSSTADEKKKQSAKPQQKDSRAKADESHTSTRETRKDSTKPQQKDSRAKADESHASETRKESSKSQKADAPAQQARRRALSPRRLEDPSETRNEPQKSEETSPSRRSPEVAPESRKRSKHRDLDNPHGSPPLPKPKTSRTKAPENAPEKHSSAGGATSSRASAGASATATATAGGEKVAEDGSPWSFAAMFGKTDKETKGDATQDAKKQPNAAPAAPEPAPTPPPRTRRAAGERKRDGEAVPVISSVAPGNKSHSETHKTATGKGAITSFKDAEFWGMLEKKPRSFTVFSAWKPKWFTIFENDRTLFMGYWATKEEHDLDETPVECFPIKSIVVVKLDQSDNKCFSITYRGSGGETVLPLRAGSHESRLEWQSHLRKVIAFLHSRKKKKPDDAKK